MHIAVVPLSSGGSAYNFRTVTSAATAATGDYVLANTTSATFAVAAPTPTAGTRWGIKWTAGTVPPTLTGTFNTAYAFSNLLQSAEFISDGTKWYRATVEAPPDLSAYALQSSLDSLAGQTYFSGGVTYVVWNGTAWPTSRPPSAGLVVIIGTSSGAGNVAPSWMVIPDLFLTPDAVGSTPTPYLAAQDFEAYNAGDTIARGVAPSGTPFDDINVVTGGTATVIADTTGGGTRMGQFTTGSTAGTTYPFWRSTLAPLTSMALGIRWKNPQVANPFGSGQNMQLIRLRRNNAGTYVNGAALRLNGTSLKFEVTDTAATVAWTSTQTYSTTPTYYDLELRVDCVNSHMQAFITPQGGTTETVGDMVTTKSTGAQLDEFAAGLLNSWANQTIGIKWIRVGDGTARVT